MSDRWEFYDRRDAYPALYIKPLVLKLYLGSSIRIAVTDFRVELFGDIYLSSFVLLSSLIPTSISCSGGVKSAIASSSSAKGSRGMEVLL